MSTIPIPHSVNLAEYSNLHYEIVGEGFEDAEGQPTRAGVFYLLGDHEGRREYGVIVSGPVEKLPYNLPDPEKLGRVPRGFLREAASIYRRLADNFQRTGRALHGASLRTLAIHLDAAAFSGPAPLSGCSGPRERADDGLVFVPEEHERIWVGGEA